KSLKLLKPGGLGVFITSKSTMDNDISADARRWFSDLDGGNSDLVAAIRLPNNAFQKDGGTQVTTDILIFKKRTALIANTHPYFITKTTRAQVYQPQGAQPQEAVMNINEYFYNHPEMMLGDMKFAFESGVRMYGDPLETTLDPTPGQDVPAELNKIADQL